MYRIEPDVREQLIGRLEAALSGRSDVLFAMLFGSFLDRETFRDIDVGLWTNDPSSPQLDLELAESLSQRLGFPVDVRRLNDAPVPFLFHALSGRPLAVRDEKMLADLMERTARDYHDRATLLRRATREAFAE